MGGPAFVALVTSLMLIGCESKGVDLGLCSDSTETCQCGSPAAGLQVQIPIKECTYFYRWKPYCKACEEYDKAALCSQFRHCLSCNAERDGKCATCPLGRYGDSCQGVCQCQNNGRCKNDGTCQCPEGFTGSRCEQRVAVSCGSAPSLSNGRVTGGSGGSVSQGTVATYTCNQGYVLVGPQRKRCEEGTWSGGDPRCEYSCTTPTPSAHLEVNVEEYRTMATSDNPNGVALVRRLNFACADGYRLVGAAELNCLPTAQWNAAAPVCVQDCGQPPNLHNGRYEGTRWTEGQVVRYFCNDRWTLSGDSSLTCRGGQWTGTAPTCSQVTCSKPVISNSVLTPNSDTYNVGASLSISCSPGFSLGGASTLTCQNNGVWNRAVPRCTLVTTTPPPVTCPTLNAPANGDVTAPGSSGVFQPGQSIGFSCNQGYLLSGNNRLICQADGSWAGTPARCIQVVTCGDPGTPVNAIRNVRQPLVGRGGRGRFRGRVVNRGRLRANSATAGGNGGDGGSVVDISIPDGRFRVLTRITFECESRFYELVGPQHRECQLNGQWSGRQPTCIPICGKSDGARAPVIHNGEASILGEWPWQASIAHRQPDGTFYGVCGGTLVTESWIITAAHCVTNRSTSNIMPLRNIKIYLGMYYRDFQRHDSEVQVYDVSEVHVHPSYDPDVLDSDIALIRLFQPATFTNRVSPVCLASVGNDGAAFTNRLLEPGLSVTVTGWGETENNTDASVLMKTQLGIISSTSCEDKYAQSGLPLVVTSNMFCAGHDDGRSDTCFGDSGGPAVAASGTGENRKWYLVGVVSWGSPLGCALQMQYSGFTKMSRFLSFVNQFTGF